MEIPFPLLDVSPVEDFSFASVSNFSTSSSVIVSLFAWLMPLNSLVPLLRSHYLFRHIKPYSLRFHFGNHFWNSSGTAIK